MCNSIKNEEHVFMMLIFTGKECCDLIMPNMYYQLCMKLLKIVLKWKFSGKTV